MKPPGFSLGAQELQEVTAYCDSSAEERTFPYSIKKYLNVCVPSKDDGGICVELAISQHYLQGVCLHVNGEERDDVLVMLADDQSCDLEKSDLVDADQSCELKNFRLIQDHTEHFNGEVRYWRFGLSHKEERPFKITGVSFLTRSPLASASPPEEGFCYFSAVPNSDLPPPFSLETPAESPQRTIRVSHVDWCSCRQPTQKKSFALSCTLNYKHESRSADVWYRVDTGVMLKPVQEKSVLYLGGFFGDSYRVVNLELPNPQFAGTCRVFFYVFEYDLSFRPVYQTSIGLDYAENI